MWVTGHDSSWVSPFGHPRITARLPTPQGLSQAPTSFIGSRCQGIHRVPFTACQHKHSTKTTKTHTTKTNTRQHTKLTHQTLHQLESQHQIPGRRLRSSCRCSRPLSKFQTPRKHQTQHPPKEAGLISQGPTVCQLIHQRAPPRFPHPHHCGSYSGMPHVDFDVHR